MKALGGDTKSLFANGAPCRREGILGKHHRLKVGAYKDQAGSKPAEQPAFSRLRFIRHRLQGGQGFEREGADARAGIAALAGAYHDRPLYAFAGEPPQGFADQMRRWYELTLRLQTPDGFWAAKPGAGSYPLIAAGLLFSLSAYHRLFGDARGFLALERYLEYADRKGEFVSGTHAFLTLLYAPFFEMERTKKEGCQCSIANWANGASN